MAIEVKYYRDDEEESLKNAGSTLKNQKKRARKKVIIIVIAVVFTAVLIGTVLWGLTRAGILSTPTMKLPLSAVKSDETDETDEKETISESKEETESETVIETEVEDTIPRDEWYMLLVNVDNPLPENFTVNLSVVDASGNEVDARIASYLKQMIEDGNSTGLQLMISSAYRSVEFQQSIWDKRVNEYVAEGMNREEAEEKTSEFIMYPDCSDHNTGLGVDIVSVTNQRMEEDFAETPEAEWLAENAWKYGFILRYPKEKESITDVKFEPWHYRYVGKEQAKIIYESGLCLEEYLDYNNFR